MEEQGHKGTVNSTAENRWFNVNQVCKHGHSSAVTCGTKMLQDKYVMESFKRGVRSTYTGANV